MGPHRPRPVEGHSTVEGATGDFDGWTASARETMGLLTPARGADMPAWISER